MNEEVQILSEHGDQTLDHPHTTLAVRAPEEISHEDDHLSHAEKRLAVIIEQILPGKLWGHSVRSLIWNPVFALVPTFYLDRFSDASSALVEGFWLVAFLLGFPHAGYTALEIKHYFMPNDGVAERRTLGQLLFFGGTGLLGGALAVWYVASGGDVLAKRFDLPTVPVMAALALVGSAGTVVGLQDVLVMDVVLRPVRVLRATANSFLRWRWLRVTLPWAALQLALAAGLRALR